ACPVVTPRPYPDSVGGTRRERTVQTRGTFAFLATQRWRGVRIWLATRKPLVLLVPLVTFITARRARSRQGPMSRCPGTIGHDAARADQKARPCGRKRIRCLSPCGPRAVP